MRPFCLRSASCGRGRTPFHLPWAFPERKLCTRSVHIHRYGVAPPASPVYEKWRHVDAFRQSPPIANRATDSTCKLPRQPRIYARSWARSYPAGAGETWIQIGPLGFFIPPRKVLPSASLRGVQEGTSGSVSMPQPKLLNRGSLEISRARRYAQERGQGQKHPGLGPSHVGDSDGTEAQDAIVKKAPLIPHVIHGPLEHRARQFDITRIEVFKRKERDDTLRHTVNVHGIRAVVKISGRAVRAEKVGLVELEPAPDARFELHCSGIAANGLQRAQVVAGMEVVNPSL